MKRCTSQVWSAESKQQATPVWLTVSGVDQHAHGTEGALAIVGLDADAAAAQKARVEAATHSAEV